MSSTVTLPEPAKLRMYRNLKYVLGKPLVRLRRRDDGYILSTYPPRQRSYFLNYWKTIVGDAQRRLANMSISELAEAFREKFGYRPRVRVRVYVDGRLLGDLTFDDPEQAEEFISSATMGGCECRVLFGIRLRGGEVWIPRGALQMMLLRGTCVSPWFIFPSYRPPTWFVHTALSRGVGEALIMYGLYIGAMAPEKVRKRVFERFLNYAKYSTDPELRQLAEKLEHLYVMEYGKKRAPPGCLWVPHLVRTFVKLARQHGMFQTANFRWTPEHEMRLLQLLNMYPKGTISLMDATAIGEVSWGHTGQLTGLVHSSTHAEAITKEKTRPGETMTMRSALEELVGKQLAHTLIDMQSALMDLLSRT